MKLKGLTKLVLAGTALAATAATLTTSTYAWYVTNSKATATGVEGKVNNTEAGSLFIAKNKIVSNADKPDNYQPSITLTQATKTNNEWDQESLNAGAYKFDQLEPQSQAVADIYKVDETVTETNFATKKAAGLFTDDQGTAAGASFDGTATYYVKTASAGDWVNAEGYTTTGKFIEFKFWLTSDSGGSASFLLKADNTSTQPTYQTALSPEGLPTTGTNTALAQGDSFAIDAIYALRMNVTKAYLEDSYEETTWATGVYEKSGDNYVVTTDTSAQNNKTYYKKFDAGVAQNLKTIKVAEVAKAWDGSNGYSTSTSTAVTTNSITFANSDGNANKYYKDVLKRDPYNYLESATDKEAVSTGDESFSSVFIPAGKDVLLTFKVWLEGSDKDCFDSCRNQTFKFDFEFSL